MFSHSDISRWLTLQIDPITLEDWVANREFFGPLETYSDLDKELEIAFQIESLRQGKSTGAKDLPLEISLNGLELSGSQMVSGGWLLAPTGPVDHNKKVVMEMEIIGSGKKEKKMLGPGEIVAIPLDGSTKYQIKIGLNGKLRIDGKDSLNLTVESVGKLIIDTRGRPIYFHPTELQKVKNRQWKEIMGVK